MNRLPAFVPVYAFVMCALLPLGAEVKQQANKTMPHLVRFSVINLSGKDREVHLRHSTSHLPVAQPVTMQAFPGEVISITSNTNHTVSQNIVISIATEGHILPIH